MDKSKEEMKEKELTGKPINNSNQKIKEQSYSLKDKLIMALIIIAVIAFGILAVNQFVEWRYNALFIQGPCQLCEKINEGISCARNVPTVSGMKINFSLPQA